VNSSAYNLSHITQALVDVGIQHGDSVFLSTGLGMLGAADGVRSKEDLNRLFLRAIKRALGAEGTIFVPAYSYAFGNSSKNAPTIFDPLTAPPKVGPFPDFFLKQKGVVRSLDPMLSVAGLGPAAETLFKDLSPTSHGDDCLYARLLGHPNAKCLNLGIGPNWIPFLHHVDWLANVPFRYDKYFFGGIEGPTGIDYVDWHYSVAVQLAECKADAHKLGKMAVDQGIWTYSPLGRGRVYASDYHQLFEFSLKSIQNNRWLTARGPACDVTKKRQEEIEKSALQSADGH